MLRYFVLGNKGLIPSQVYGSVKDNLTIGGQENRP
jgi:hypothetical protein